MPLLQYVTTLLCLLQPATWPSNFWAQARPDQAIMLCKCLRCFLPEETELLRLYPEDEVVVAWKHVPVISRSILQGCMVVSADRCVGQR